MNKLILSAVLVTALACPSLAQIRGSAANLPAAERPSINVLRVASNVADAETVTIGGVVFEVDTASTPTITAGRQRVDCNSGVTPTLFTTALEASVNATNVLGFRVRATRISASEVLITNATAAAVACTETLAGTNNAWAAATTFGGATALAAKHVEVLTRAATAAEAALTTMHFVAAFAPTTATVQVRSSAGALVAFDGSVTITGNRVDVLSGGSVPVASTNIVTVTAGD